MLANPRPKGCARSTPLYRLAWTKGSSRAGWSAAASARNGGCSTWCRCSPNLSLRRWQEITVVLSCSMLSPGQEGAQPNRGVAQRDAAHDIGQPNPEAALAHRRVGLPFETGKRGVAAEEPHHQHEPPVGVRL